MENLYALLVIPPEDIKKSLEEIIFNLSRRYDGPIFEPHMTLLGGIGTNEKTIIQKAQELAKGIKPFKIILSEVSFGTTYFQNVFVRVKSTAKLMEANLKAKEIFNIGESLFMPHISLLYGKQGMNLREKAASEIKLPDNLSFTAEKIVIARDSQNPADWQHLSEVKIG